MGIGQAQSIGRFGDGQAADIAAAMARDWRARDGMSPRANASPSYLNQMASASYPIESIGGRRAPTMTSQDRDDLRSSPPAAVLRPAISPGRPQDGCPQFTLAAGRKPIPIISLISTQRTGFCIETVTKTAKKSSVP